MALALHFGQYTIMNEGGYRNNLTTLFIDFGASHVVASVVQFSHRSIKLVASCFTDKINSRKINQLIVNEIIIPNIEQDKEAIEEAEESIEDVIGKMNTYNNHKRLEDFKIICSSGNTKQVTASWSGKEEYDGYCRVYKGVLL